MNRDEALKLVGKRVEAWTALNGRYCGVLSEVISKKGKPWRAAVLIDGILEPACHFQVGGACRRGYRVGEIIEVGGVNISETDVTGEADYEMVLKRTAATARAWLAGEHADPKYLWSQKGTADACEAAIRCEQKRKTTGEWDHRLLASAYLEIARMTAKKVETEQLKMTDEAVALVQDHFKNQGQGDINIEFAEATDVERQERVAELFMSAIFDMQPDDYFISDDSYLSDFAGCNDLENVSAIERRIEEVFHVKVGSRRLVDIFETIKGLA